MFVKLVGSVVEELDGCKDSVIIFGCVAGLNSFLLTRLFQKVTGVDYSGRFLDAAIRIQSGECVKYGEGKAAALPQGSESSKVVFKQVRLVAG